MSDHEEQPENAEPERAPAARDEDRTRGQGAAMPDSFQGDTTVGVSRAEMRLIRRAAIAHWPIPPDLLRVIPGQIARILANDDVPPRTKIAAMKLVHALQKHNLDLYDKIMRLGEGGADEVRFVRAPLRGPPAPDDEDD